MTLILQALYGYLLHGLTWCPTITEIESHLLLHIRNHCIGMFGFCHRCTIKWNIRGVAITNTKMSKGLITMLKTQIVPLMDENTNIGTQPQRSKLWYFAKCFGPLCWWLAVQSSWKVQSKSFSLNPILPSPFHLVNCIRWTMTQLQWVMNE